MHSGRAAELPSSLVDAHYAQGLGVNSPMSYNAEEIGSNNSTVTDGHVRRNYWSVGVTHFSQKFAFHLLGEYACTRVSS